MPTYEITDSQTGKKLRVTGDSPPTQEEQEALFSQFSLSQVSPEQIQAESHAREIGPLESLAVSAGRGLTTIGRSIGLAEPEDPAVTRSFEALQEERPISTTVGEIAGESAPFLIPGGAIGNVASLPARAAAAGALGVAEGAAISEGKGGSSEDTALSAGIGGLAAGSLELVAPQLSRLGGKIYRGLTGKAPTAPMISREGVPSAELAEALDATGISLEDLNAEAVRRANVGDVEDIAMAARKEFLESQGITPIKAQITGEATDFQSQQELAKVSGRVRRAIEGQDEVLAGRFDNAVTQTGGSANASSSLAVDAIADRAIDLDSAISSAYKAARESAPKDKIVKPEALADAIRGVGGSDTATGGLASAARDILKTKGVVAEGRGLKIIGKVDPKTAEEIRIDLNSLHSSLTPIGKKRLSELKAALDEDVAGAVGEDIFKDARSAKAKFESDLNRVKVNKFDSRKRNLVRDILENKINPDRFLDDAVLSRSVRSADLEQLKRYLQLDGSDEGVAAWNQIRSESMERIKQLAVPEVAGQPALSRAGIEKALDRFGRDKLRVLFSREERKFLNDMVKVAKLREPVRGTALGRGPSAQGIDAGSKLISQAINRIPLLSQVFGGLGTQARALSATGTPLIAPTRATGLSQLGGPVAAAIGTQTAQDEEK